MADRYWVGGTGNWSDTAHWAETDGGGGGKSVPTDVDDVYITSNSGFGSGGSITEDAENVVCRNFTATSGHTYSMVYSECDIMIHGNAVFEVGLTWDEASAAYTNFEGAGSKTITSNGCRIGYAYFDEGTFTLTDDMLCGYPGDGGALDIYSGNFYSNNYTITITTPNAEFQIGSASGGDLGTSLIYLGDPSFLDVKAGTTLNYSNAKFRYPHWIPRVELYATIDNTIGIPIPMFSLAGDIIVGKIIEGALSIPVQTMGGVLNTVDAHGTMIGTIPEMGLEALGGGEADLDLPRILLLASASVNVSATLSKALARITLTASAHTDTNGTLNLSIPAVKLTATATMSPVASLEKPIPMIRLTASAIAGMVASLAESLPALTIDASSYWLKGATLEKAIPAILLDARVRGVAAEIIALSMNTKNFGLTKYTDYSYNSLCVFNGKLIGAKRTGIYELEGNDDEGSNIEWKLRTPQINLDKNKLRNVWLYGKVSGDLKMVVETAEGYRYEYDAEPVEDEEDAVRIKVGRGLDSKYITIEFINESDQRVTIDKIQGFGVKA